MWITRLSLANPVAVALFYALLGLGGLAAFASLGRSLLPPLAFPIVTISAPYPGASARELEQLVVEPLEQHLDRVPGVNRVNVSIQQGIASLSVRFRFGSDLNTARMDVQQALNAAQAEMPSDMVPPVVSPDDAAQPPIIEEAISSAVLTPMQLSDAVARKIAPAIRSAAGVGNVAIVGAVTPQFTIAPRSAAMNALGVTLLDVFRAVEAGNDVLPGGSLRQPGRESAIGIQGGITRVEQLGELPLSAPGSAGSSVRLDQVAKIRYDRRDDAIIARVDDVRAILLYIAPARGADALHTIANIRPVIRALADAHPLIRFAEIRSDQPFTTAAIDGVLQTLAEGVLLTVLVMLFFLHSWRNAAIAAISVPASLCAAFVCMSALGFTLNLLSLMGLSLTIGILVDDSIVIVEAISRFARAGMPAGEAALAGRQELGAVAVAITLVDVAVFAPIGAMSGLIGEFMREFGLVVVIATSFSLLVSFTLAPLLAARWGLRATQQSLDGLEFEEVTRRLQTRAREYPWTIRGWGLQAAALWHVMLNRFDSFQERVATTYARRWLPWALQHRWQIASSAAALCVLSVLVTGMIPAELSPPVGRGQALVQIRYPAGTPLSDVDAGMRRLTNALEEDARVGSVVTTSGAATIGGAPVQASNVAQLAVVLADPNASGDDLTNEVRRFATVVPGAELVGAGQGMGGGALVDYIVRGDASRVNEGAERLAAALRANGAATDVQTGDLGVGPNLVVAPIPGVERLLGVTPDDAAQTARIATSGARATRARLPMSLVDVVVQADAAERGDLDAFGQFAVRANNGMLVPLARLMTMRVSTAPLIIQREDGARVVTVTANAANGAPSSAVTGPTSTLLRTPGFFPAGIQVEPHGDAEQFFDAVRNLGLALALSGLAVYTILAVLYRSYMLPLIIMTTVPLASIGAFGTLFVLGLARGAAPHAQFLNGQSLNIYSMLGIVMLVGLVAKNGILLVEHAERAMRTGADAVTAISSAAQRRFRPIVMTTIAMIAGMLPLALGQSAGAEYRMALGTVVVGGLSSSLLLTLFLVPVVYVWYRERAGALEFREERDAQRAGVAQLVER